MWVARNPCMIEELSINYNKLARCRISLHGWEIMLWNERWIGNLWLHQKVKCYISLLGGRGTIKAGGIDVENTRVNVVNSTIISTKIPASRQSEAFIWWAGGWGIIIIILLQPPPLALRYRKEPPGAEIFRIAIKTFIIAPAGTDGASWMALWN